MASKQSQSTSGSQSKSTPRATLRAPRRTTSEIQEVPVEGTDDQEDLRGQLVSMGTNIKQLGEDMKTVLKKQDLEDLIEKSFDRFQDKIMKLVERKVKDETKEINDRLEGLVHENEVLKERLSCVESQSKKDIKDLRDDICRHHELTKEANKRSNYNEQYSRKNNVKILDIKQDRLESEETLISKVSTIIKDKTGVIVKPEQILAIHRIPGRRDRPKPVLIKFTNNNAKASVMKNRRAMKEGGHRLIDDVTKCNQGLIGRLSLHPSIQNAWYFNGSVYGQTSNEGRIKFDLYDNVNEVIAKLQSNRA